ncbi:MAG TPA: serine/threonine-protein kinase [Hyalangium sp.]|nr:serine/threonine-protein kinase [Hyalangium sp.]
MGPELIERCPACGGSNMGARCAACGAAARPGGYEVVRLIARTPHSRVYLARSPAGQEVALKELLFAQVPGPQELDAFEREARLLQTISHPRIPRLLGYFQEGQGAELRLYLAAEHISGETLLERLAHHAFSEQEAQELGLQVLEILEYLHARKPRVLHRDIKPANLIRQPDGGLFLVDFGAARESVKGATSGATLVGTFGYMPLEQFGGTVDVTSDLYALGATLVHLLGRTPPADLFQPDRGLDLSNLDASVLRPWLRKLTALRPEERYRSAKLARQALEALRPGGHRAHPVQGIASASSPDAPAALARLAEEAKASREDTSKSLERWERQGLEKAESEARKREQRRAQLDDDRLTLMDFYRMACLPAAAPAVLPWIGFLIGMGVYIVSAKLGFDVPSLLTLDGLLLILGLIFLAYTGLGGPALIQALRWRRAFQRLPFALEGLGRLVHRAEGEWRRFTRCSLRIEFQGVERSRAAGGLVKTARANAQQLAVDRMNAALSRIRMARHPEFFQKLRWTLQRDSAEGHANWRLAGQLLAFCLERLVPLQNELGLIRAVHLDSQREHFDLPAKRR